jgi:hypothetical protein
MVREIIETVIDGVVITFFASVVLICAGLLITGVIQ